MILSLLIAGIVFIPAIAMVGISPMGADMLGGEGTITSMANATFWCTYSSFGLSIMIPIVVGGVILVSMLILVVRKTEPISTVT